MHLALCGYVYVRAAPRVETFVAAPCAEVIAKPETRQAYRGLRQRELAFDRDCCLFFLMHETTAPIAARGGRSRGGR
jgi:hypothetical protein